ncbi:MAG: WHG domain-containing protein [Lachnospiraceae bacterium]|nr:WHG domain-containing protein [Lachnospiraceae bacterium]
MARVGLDKNVIVERAAGLANERGLDNITLKIIADEFGVQSPSLYNHINSLDDLKKSLMLYGWKQVETKLLLAVVGVSGYDALRAMCYAFYEYATDNPGVFNAMLWYNKFQDEETHNATKQLFGVLFKIMGTLNIPEETINHLIRTFRGFLEGYALLVNNGAFGNPASIKESFDLSVEVLLAGIQNLERESKI